MHWSFHLLLWTAFLNPSPKTDLSNQLYYQNYTDAYRSAQSAEMPMLVILNPAGDSGVSMDGLLRTRTRRELLQNYVIARIDTGTKRGKLIHKLFGSQSLPRVVVIDKQQKLQIYQTSDHLTFEDWNLVLGKYKNGQYVARQRAICFT